MFERKIRKFLASNDGFVPNLSGERVTVRAHGCPKPVSFVIYWRHGKLFKPEPAPLWLLPDSQYEAFMAHPFPRPRTKAARVAVWLASRLS